MDFPPILRGRRGFYLVSPLCSSRERRPKPDVSNLTKGTGACAFTLAGWTYAHATRPRIRPSPLVLRLLRPTFRLSRKAAAFWRVWCLEASVRAQKRYVLCLFLIRYPLCRAANDPVYSRQHVRKDGHFRRQIVAQDLASSNSNTTRGTSYIEYLGCVQGADEDSQIVDRLLICLAHYKDHLRITAQIQREP